MSYVACRHMPYLCRLRGLSALGAFHNPYWRWAPHAWSSAWDREEQCVDTGFPSIPASRWSRLIFRGQVIQIRTGQYSFLPYPACLLYRRPTMKASSFSTHIPLCVDVLHGRRRQTANVNATAFARRPGCGNLRTVRFPLDLLIIGRRLAEELRIWSPNDNEISAQSWDLYCIYPLLLLA